MIIQANRIVTGASANTLAYGLRGNSLYQYLSKKFVPAATRNIKGTMSSGNEVGLNSNIGTKSNVQEKII